MSGNLILDGKTIVVTGAATGIGQAFSLAAAAHGAKVVVADMNPAQETVELIEGAGGQAKYVQVDVSKQDSTDAMAQAAIE